jgi:exoribonuclease II
MAWAKIAQAMYALFDDAGKFHAGRVMSESDASLQVELASGKRVKVKSANVLLRFDSPEPGALIAQAQTQAQEIDLDLAWEFAPEGEFGFADLARDYFNAKASTVQQAAALFKLHEAPHYFRRAGKGAYKKAPEETVKAALLGIERKKQLAAQIDAWAGELVQGQCPAPIAEQLYKILFKPDKNTPEYKAVVEAAKRSQRAPLDLLKAAGAITSAYQFHWKRFLFEQFPNNKGGTGFPNLEAPAPKSTTRSRCKAWAAARWYLACTSPHPAWRLRPARRWTQWRCSACPPSTCPAGSSPCCPMGWWHATPSPRAKPARP